jgi:photosystem II stability/assembly factor-like uncharacterized protein
MGKRASQGVYAILLLLMFIGPLHAQVWDTIPPPLGGIVHSHVHLGSLHYALVTDIGIYDNDPAYPHLFRSTDDGDNWQEHALPSGGPAFRFRLRLDGPDNLYYLGEQALFRTSDNGATWTRCDSSLNAAGSRAELEIDSAGRLYLLVMGQGVFLSTDQGSSWTSCTPPSGRQLTLFTHLACIQDDLFMWWGNAAADADTLFRSTDRGTSWSPFLTGMVPRQVIDGGNGRILVSRFVVENGIIPFQILCTTTMGQQWDTLYVGRATSGFAEFRREEREFARTDGGMLAHAIYDTTYTRSVLVSSDGGATWTTMHDPAMDYFTGISFNARGHLLVFGLHYGFLRYQTPLSETEQIGLYPVPVNRPPCIAEDGTIHALTESMNVGYLFLWHASLRTWEMVAGPPIMRDTRGSSSTSIFTASPDTIYTTLFNPVGALSRTRNMGRTWEPIRPAGLISYGNTSSGSGSWFAMSADSIYRSQNNGRDWASIRTPEQSRPGPVAEIGGTVLYLAYSQSRLWLKSNPDSAWTSRALPLRCKALVTGSGPVLYLSRALSGEIIRTSNLGDTWEYPKAGYGYAHELLAIEQDGLLALDTSRGLTSSTDRGENWTLRGLPGMAPRSMAMKNGSLYIGTHRLGILRTPVAPMLVAITQLKPGNLASCEPATVTLEWSAQSLPGPYRVRCGTNPSFFPTTLIRDTTIIGSSLLLGNLSPGITYYWDVTCNAGGNNTQQSTVFQFSTAAVPIVSITNPSPDAGCVQPSGQLTWTQQPCMSYSDVEFSRDAAFQNIASSVHVQGDASSAAFALAYGTQYYARVRSTSAGGTGAWSTAVSFRTIDDVVAAPLQIQPADQSTITVGPPGLIKWEKVDCVKQSEIVVARTADFSADTVAHALKNDPYNYLAMSGGQWTNGTYYWKVRAWRDTVPGHWSPVWSFTLDIPVPVEANPVAEDFGILRVYPMPVGEMRPRVTVECAVQGSSPANIIVLDMLGRQHLRISLASIVGSRQSIPLDVSALPSGQYRIVLQSGANRASVPLLIVR